MGVSGWWSDLRILRVFNLIPCFVLVLGLQGIGGVYALAGDNASGERCLNMYKSKVAENYFYFEEVGVDEIDVPLRRAKEFINGRSGEIIKVASQYWIANYSLSNDLTANTFHQLRAFETSQGKVLMKTDFGLDKEGNYSLTTEFEYFKQGKSFPDYSIAKSYDINSACQLVATYANSIKFVPQGTQLKVIETRIDLIRESFEGSEDILQTNIQKFEGYSDESYYLIADLSFLKNVSENQIKTINFYEHNRGLIDYNIKFNGPLGFIFSDTIFDNFKRKLMIQCIELDFSRCNYSSDKTRPSDSTFFQKFTVLNTDMASWLSSSMYFNYDVSFPVLATLPDHNYSRVTFKTSSELSLHNISQYWRDIKSSPSEIQFRLGPLNYLGGSLPLATKALTQDEDFLVQSEFIDPFHPDILKWKQDNFSGFTGTRREAISKINQYIASNLSYDYILLENEILNFKNTAAILNRKKGICTDFSNVFVAMARSIGIPARIVNGYAFFKGNQIKFDFSHAWVEVNLDNKNWTPIEPNGGEFVIETPSLYIPIMIAEPSSSAEHDARLTIAFGNKSKINAIDIK